MFAYQGKLTQLTQAANSGIHCEICGNFNYNYTVCQECRLLLGSNAWYDFKPSELDYFMSALMKNISMNDLVAMYHTRGVTKEYLEQLAKNQIAIHGNLLQEYYDSANKKDKVDVKMLEKRRKFNSFVEIHYTPKKVEKQEKKEEPVSLEEMLFA